MSLGSIGFQVRIQRHLRICSGDNLSRSSLVTVLVFNQFWISLDLALWNSSFSNGDSRESFTSLRCRRAAVAMKANSSGRSDVLQSWISWSVAKISNLQASSGAGWRVSCSSSGTSEHQSPSATSYQSFRSGHDGQSLFDRLTIFGVFEMSRHTKVYLNGLGIVIQFRELWKFEHQWGNWLLPV